METWWKHTLLVMIKTCCSAQPHEKGVHFMTVFKVGGQMVKQGEGSSQDRGWLVRPGGFLYLPQGE